MKIYSKQAKTASISFGIYKDEHDGVKKEFTYTAFDRIKTSRVYFGGEPNVSIANTYRYDGLQRRVLQDDKSKKTLRSVYVHTSLNILNEWEVNRDGSAITNRPIGSRQYFYAAGELYSIKEYRLANSGIEYFYKDRQASIKAAAYGDGNIRQRIDYTPFGEPLGTWMLAAGYLSKPYDFNTRLSNYGFRDYAPHTGRFTTADPIRDGLNWYTYVNNDPVNWVDLWGLSASDGKWVMSHFFLENFGTKGKPYLHSGKDWIFMVHENNKTEGAPVYSQFSGTVVEAITGESKTASDLGNRVRILLSDGGQYNTFHYSSVCVNKNQSVAVGDLLGYAGNTGKVSEGAHLHVEIRYEKKPQDIPTEKMLYRYERYYVEPPNM